MFFFFDGGVVNQHKVYRHCYSPLKTWFHSELPRPWWDDFVKFTATICFKKRKHVLSQPKNNAGLITLNPDIHQHIVQSYWQHKVPFNQHCHINWQRGFQRFKNARSSASSSFSDGFMIHSFSFEKDPLLPCTCLNWDATGELYCLGPTGTPISISSCTLFNLRASKHAAMFRRTVRVGRRVAHLTPSPLFFLE